MALAPFPAAAQTDLSIVPPFKGWGPPRLGEPPAPGLGGALSFDMPSGRLTLRQWPVGALQSISTDRQAPPPKVGPRAAAAMRRSPTQTIEVLVAGMTEDALRRAGLTPVGRSGPVVSARGTPSSILDLLRQNADSTDGLWLDAPQALRPTLDRIRRITGADRVDEGLDFPEAFRGSGVLVAAYDSGVDLTHPDLRSLDGPSRFRAVWDQEGTGTPPDAGFGASCTRSQLVANRCNATDETNHGTSVMGVAASGGPQYRGIAPEADLIMVGSSTLGALVPALDYARDVAQTDGRPLVFNISLTGHQGPHDGTSLEAMAINAYPHPVVVSAGNEGDLPIHGTAGLTAEPTTFVLRFPALLERQDRRAVVDVWSDADASELSASVAFIDGQQISFETPVIAPGDEGRTEVLLVGGVTVGSVALDAAPEPNPFNGRRHIRIAFELFDWEDAPLGAGYFAVRLRGNGRVHLWVDSPDSEPSPVRLDDEGIFAGQALGDRASTLGDIATASAAITVSAYVGRLNVTAPDGQEWQFDGTLDRLASYSSRGPTLNLSNTGDKPDIAAPGQVLIAARSRTAMPSSTDLSPLYRVVAGTSFAAPVVTGAVAVLLSADPSLEPSQIKEIIKDAANPPPDEDLRWGAGQLRVDRALTTVVGTESGCRCQTPRRPPDGTVGLLLVGLVVGLGVRMIRVRRACLGCNQA
ncbi:MAG: S8 family serine peptidase [Myxococcota bacterium]